MGSVVPRKGEHAVSPGPLSVSGACRAGDTLRARCRGCPCHQQAEKLKQARRGQVAQEAGDGRASGLSPQTCPTLSPPQTATGNVVSRPDTAHQDPRRAGRLCESGRCAIPAAEHRALTRNGRGRATVAMGAETPSKAFLPATGQQEEVMSGKLIIIDQSTPDRLGSQTPHGRPS